MAKAKGADAKRASRDAVYPDEIIPEWRATSSRNAERDQIGLVGDIISDSRATSPGIRTSGLAVLDVDVKDPKKYGPDSLDDLGRSILDQTWITHTSSGGWHCYYDALETDIPSTSHTLGLGARCSRQHRLRHRPLARVEIQLGPGQLSRRCSAGPGAGLAHSAAARSQAHRFDQAG